jgi:hypothetical protein
MMARFRKDMNLDASLSQRVPTRRFAFSKPKARPTRDSFYPHEMMGRTDGARMRTVTPQTAITAFTAVSFSSP